MTEEAQQIPVLQETPIQPQTDLAPQQPKKSNKKNWIIFGGVIGVIGLCVIACVAIFGASMFRIYTEKAPIESVFTAYMQYMARKDADGAYTLFSPRAKRQIPISTVNEMLEGNNYFLFDGFQSLSATNLNISVTVNPDDDLPQGTVAQVTGTITFEGDIQGSFNGVLEKVGDQWMIHSIYVTVPPTKIK